MNNEKMCHNTINQTVCIENLNEYFLGTGKLIARTIYFLRRNIVNTEMKFTYHFFVEMENIFGKNGTN